MSLIQCPECNKSISDRAEICPHCGLPAEFFADSASVVQTTSTSTSLDLSKLRNSLISFDHGYHNLYGANHYITKKELTVLEESFAYWAEILKDRIAYSYCVKNASKNAIDMELVNTCLKRYEKLIQDAESHNAKYTDTIVEENKEYFDNLLKDIDPSIMLDDEQRRAVVTDEDYCLLVAGAGAGKTTTMAAKVKYLVDKMHIPPEEIIVISYTNKAIDELKERINKGLRISARICTFHSFAYDIVRKFSDTPPEVNYTAYKIIFEMLEKAVFNDKKLLRKILLFLGYYFDLPADAMNYRNLNDFHLAKAAQDFETLKSGAGEYIKKVAIDRGRRMKTLTGEYLRSVQETQIANFLFLNGLDYEYEPVYPHNICGAKKKYTPDFLIRQGEHTAYLEHYAIGENRHSFVLTPEEIIRYNKAIESKRVLHQKKGQFCWKHGLGTKINDRFRST